MEHKHEDITNNCSNKIKDFIDFIDECRRLNSMASEAVATEEKRRQDLLHFIEFESSSKKRGPIDTKLHNCLNERRKYKDIYEETEDIVAFFQDSQHEKTLDQLRQLLGKVRKVEKYYESRTYIPRVAKAPI